MKRFIFLFMIVSVFVLTGCETLPPPTPQQIIANPFGTSPLKIGMKKEEVISLWGQPNEVVAVGRDELGMPREEWIYHARYPAAPVDYNYLSQTKILVFAGNSLVNWKEK